MSNLCILEYTDVGSTQRGSIEIPLEPPLAEQGVEIGFQSNQSQPLKKATSIVKLVADADCAIAIGQDPDATNSARFLAAGKEQLLTVVPGSNLKIAVVATGSGSMSDSLGAFLKVIASPAEAQKNLDALNKQAAVIDDAAAKLRMATDDHKKAKAELDAAAKAAADAEAAADAAADDAAQKKSALAAARQEFDARVEVDARAAADKSKELSDRESKLNKAVLNLDAKAQDLVDASNDLAAREKVLADEAAAVAALRADYEARLAKLKALTS